MRDYAKAQCTGPHSWSLRNFPPPRLRCCRVPGCSVINKVAKRGLGGQKEARIATRVSRATTDYNQLHSGRDCLSELQTAAAVDSSMYAGEEALLILTGVTRKGRAGCERSSY
jgi:hypothetical protein